jgi:integrase
MRVRLKGVHRVAKRLAGGRVVVYFYAWRGGPRIEGAPGSAEFIASFNAACSAKPRSRRAETLSALLDAYQDSDDFLSLRERTRADYAKLIKQIERRFGEMPIAALADKRARGDFLAWRDELAKRSRRQADYAWTVLARVLSWALDRRLADDNPCAKGGRLYHGSRADKTWSEADVAAFLACASAPIALAMQLALWTGQRQGDLLRLPWSAYDGAWIRLKQSKTGQRVAIKVGAPLKVLLDATKRRSTQILTNSDGAAWTSGGFSSSWRKTCAKASIAGLTFHDLRGTAVLRLSLAGATVPEIATLTGHKINNVQSVLDAHYFSRDAALAESAVTKLEARQGAGAKGAPEEK